MTCYLIHFDEPYKHARHYIGTTNNLPRRIATHKRGEATRSSRLMAAVHDAGIGWTVARTWEGGRDLEIKLHNWHGGAQLCPICRGEIDNAVQ